MEVILIPTVAGTIKLQSPTNSHVHMYSALKFNGRPVV